MSATFVIKKTLQSKLSFNGPEFAHPVPTLKFGIALHKICRKSAAFLVINYGTLDSLYFIT
jgi:hypothetical protein